MFRRQPVREKLGYWDSVRFASDSEFIERIRLVFGRKSVTSLAEAGPLSFQRQLESSLTGSNAFGFHGFFMGARLAYHEASRGYHRAAKGLRYEFPQDARPFAIPEPMRPEREVGKDSRRRFDVILVADFRMLGRFKARSLARIDEETGLGNRVGLIQMARYDLDPWSKVHPVFLDLEDHGKVEFIVYGEQVCCDRLVVLHSPVLETFQRFVPDVEAKEVVVVLDETPMELTTTEARRTWLTACKQNARRYFGSIGVWVPTNPRLRALLDEDERCAETTVADRG
jgi:hypothetical protein